MANEHELKEADRTRKAETEAISNPGRTPGPAGTNPFSEGRTGTTGGTGNVNPSGPTTGTEAWGSTGTEVDTTGAGQGHLGRDDKTKPVHSNTESTETGETSAVERTFRCADAGNADCPWETSARSDDDLMKSIEQHGREAHGVDNFDASTKRKFQNAIRERAA